MTKPIVCIYYANEIKLSINATFVGVFYLIFLYTKYYIQIVIFSHKTIPNQRPLANLLVNYTHH
jgi:hypothetical protein